VLLASLLLGLGPGMPAPAGIQVVERRVLLVEVASPGEGHDQAFLADVLTELLQKNVQRAMTEEKVGLPRIERFALPEGTDPADWRAAAAAAPFDGSIDLTGPASGEALLLIPQLESSSLGYRLRVRAVQLVPGGEPEVGPVELAVMSDDVKLGQVEKEVEKLVKSLVLRLSGRARRVLLWCVEPVPPEDGALGGLLRRLVLELPFHLTQVSRAGSHPYEFASLDPSEYFGHCMGQERGSAPAPIDFDSYDFVLSGQARRIRSSTARLELLVDPRVLDTNVPLRALEVPLEIDTLGIGVSAATVLEVFLEGVASEPPP
jgi:hypothetical protein